MPASLSFGLDAHPICKLSVSLVYAMLNNNYGLLTGLWWT